jgi:hypothetical protein
MLPLIPVPTCGGLALCGDMFLQGPLKMKKHVSAKKARPRHVGTGKELRCLLRHEMNIVLTGQLVKPLSIRRIPSKRLFFSRNLEKEAMARAAFLTAFFGVFLSEFSMTAIGLYDPPSSYISLFY